MAALEPALRVSRPEDLGFGRDATKYPRKYRKLEVAFAWRILLSQDRQAIFEAKKHAALRELVRAENKSVPVHEVKSRLNEKLTNLPISSSAMQRSEGWYLHGTKPETVLPILCSGLNERMCGGLFGSGVYLAEDPEKADQYVTPDSKYGASGLEELHSRLFRGGARHPQDDIFYVFVCRAVAGVPVRTKDGILDLDNSKGLFASFEKRELAEIPGLAPVRFHSLVAEVGGKIHRFREFVHFDAARVRAEYLVAYRRLP